MSDPDRSEAEIFGAALELPEPSRGAFLARACAGDADLLRRVTRLLEAHRLAGDFLQDSAPQPEGGWRNAANASAEEVVGVRIGRYRLIERLGEGGCGVVWMAEQEEPFRRMVALKVIKLGMDTREVIARFESERQALAMMDHPNVATVLDAGATASGRPYFVMELVRGSRITHYCDQHHLSTVERLRLFMQVCGAIQHAHQKGIIHRDIKPSNILVTQIDGVPAPKVIDFGIAKATQGRLVDQTLFTAFEQLVGTPAYMSPEQTQPGNQDVDTRSDIYSLGVLLYELLTGQTLFDSKSLARAGLDEIRRIIREVDPPRPSSRLATLGSADLATVARMRGTEPSHLSSLLRGDLDWVVLKALEKQREHRYATPLELAADVGRHLRDEPVEARAPGLTYRVGKFVRRHRLGVAVAAGAAALLAVTSMVSSVLALRAMRAERRAARVSAIFEQLLDGVGQTATLTPPNNLARNAREWGRILDETAVRAMTQVADDPEVAAEVARVFGRIYLATGQPTEAGEMFRRAISAREPAFGRDDPLALEARYDLGIAYWQADSVAAGNALLEQVIDARRRTLGPDHPATVRVVEMLGFGLWVYGDPVRAETLLRQALEARERTGRVTNFDNRHFSILNGYASCLLALGRNEEGLAFAQRDLEALTAIPDPPRRFLSRAHLTMSWALKAAGRPAEALPYARAAVAIDLREIGPDHPELSFSLYELANSLSWSGNPSDVPEGVECYRRCIELWRTKLGTDWPKTLIGYLETLANVLRREGRHAEAAPLLEEAWGLVVAARQPGCEELAARVLKTGMTNAEARAQMDVSSAVAAQEWERRFESFEARLRTLPHDAYRLNAVRGLANVLSDWEGTDPSRGAAAAWWRSELERSEAEARAALAAPK